MSSFIDEMKKRFSKVRCSVSSYTSKGGRPVILYQFYQWKDSERVWMLYDYWSKWRVFKDLIHNIGYTDSEYLV